MVPPATRQQPLAFNGDNTLINPAGVAVDKDGNVYVADHDNNRVLKLAVGSTTPTMVLDNQYVHWPAGVAVDHKGDLYVTDPGWDANDLGHNRVLELAVGATIPTVLPFDRISGPLAVAVDANDA